MNTNALTADAGLKILSDVERISITTQVAEATSAAQQAKESALAITSITDQGMLDIASGELRELATVRARLKDRRLEITRPMDAAKAFVMDLFASPDGELEQGETHLRGLVGGYLAEQKRQEAVRRAEADRKAREEREAAEAVFAAAQTPEAKEAALDALELAEVGTTAVAATTPKARGVSTSDRWVVGEIDKVALIKGAAADPEKFARYLTVNETALRQFVSLMKAEAVVPGVTFQQDSSLRVRRS